MFSSARKSCSVQVKQILNEPDRTSEHDVACICYVAHCTIRASVSQMLCKTGASCNVITAQDLCFDSLSHEMPKMALLRSWENAVPNTKLLERFCMRFVETFCNLCLRWPAFTMNKYPGESC